MGRLSNSSLMTQNTKQLEQQLHLSQLAMQSDDERMILLSGEINESSIAMASTSLLALANRDRYRPIHIIINTYGGSIDEMYCMYDVMKYVKTPIYTVGLGKIMSAGVLLLAAGAKGKRLIGQNARVMMHAISSGAYGNVFELMNHTSELVSMQQKFEECIVNETKMNHSDVNDIMKKATDMYMTSSDAVKFGIADQLIG